MYSSSDSATPVKIATVSSSTTPTTTVTRAAPTCGQETHRASTRWRTSLVSASTPMTMRIAASVGIGIRSASPPAIATSTTRSTPADTPAQRDRAPADTFTPVRDSDPPDGRARNRPPTRFAAPWATKSRFMSERAPPGLGYAAPTVDASASPTMAAATAAGNSSGTRLKSGQWGVGMASSPVGMLAMSPTVCTESRPSPDTSAMPRTIATMSAYDRSLVRLATTRAMMHAMPTIVVAPSQRPACAVMSTALMTFPPPIVVASEV